MVLVAILEPSGDLIQRGRGVWDRVELLSNVVSFMWAGHFSVGLICYPASLPWNGYDNNTARLTTSVLRRLVDPTPL